MMRHLLTSPTSMVLALGALVVVGLACNRSSADQKSSGTRLFEMRTYITHPGRMDALNKRFREHTNKLFVKHGMELVGYWTPVAGGKGSESVDAANTLVYILAYPNMEAREASWKAFAADPDWKVAKAESEKDGPIVSKVIQQFLTPTDYSPIK